MRKFSFPTVSFLLLGFLSPVSAQSVDLGRVELEVAGATIPIRVQGSTPEIDSLAQVAFNAHGQFRRVSSGQTYTFSFTVVGENAVRLDVLRANGAAMLSQTLTGSGVRDALLRAADRAVTATTGLPGIFASKLSFIGERTGKREVYTADLFFGEVRQITRDGALALNPRWSPDGRKILYTSYFRSGFPDIFLLNLETNQRTSFVSFKGTNGGARFSPDGRHVAMVLSGEGNPEVYIANSEGRQVKRVTRTRSVEASPCFSPDGQKLVFTSDSAGGPQLYVMNRDGSGVRRLPTNISGYCAEPDWSSGDPTKIAFTFQTGRQFQIGVFDLNAGGPAVVVSKAAYDAVEPVWLADGRHLVFTARAANQRSIYILDTVTKKETRLSAAAAGSCSQASVLQP